MGNGIVLTDVSVLGDDIMTFVFLLLAVSSEPIL